jgi:hypothetical protein
VVKFAIGLITFQLLSKSLVSLLNAYADANTCEQKNTRNYKNDNKGIKAVLFTWWSIWLRGGVHYIFVFTVKSDHLVSIVKDNVERLQESISKEISIFSSLTLSIDEDLANVVALSDILSVKIRDFFLNSVFIIFEWQHVLSGIAIFV